MGAYKSEHVYRIQTTFNQIDHYNKTGTFKEEALRILETLYLDIQEGLARPEFAWLKKFVSLIELEDLTAAELRAIQNSFTGEYSEADLNKAIMSSRLKKSIREIGEGDAPQMAGWGMYAARIPLIQVGIFKISVCAHYHGSYSVGWAGSRWNSMEKKLTLYVDKIEERYKDITTEYARNNILVYNNSSYGSFYRTWDLNQSTAGDSGCLYYDSSGIMANITEPSYDFNLDFMTNEAQDSLIVKFEDFITIAIDDVIPIDDTDGFPAEKNQLSYVILQSYNDKYIGVGQNTTVSQFIMAYLDDERVYEKYAVGLQPSTRMYCNQMLSNTVDDLKLSTAIIDKYYAKHLKYLEGTQMLVDTFAKINDQMAYTSFGLYYELESGSTDPFFEQRLNGRKINFHDLKMAIDNGKQTGISVTMDEDARAINFEVTEQNPLNFTKLSKAFVHNGHQGIVASADETSNQISLTVSGIAIPTINDAGHWEINNVDTGYRAIAAVTNKVITRYATFKQNAWIFNEEKHYYEQKVDIEDVAESAYPIMDVWLADETIQEWPNIQDSYAKLQKVLTVDGGLVGIVGAIPDSDIPVVIRIAGDGTEGESGGAFATKADIDKLNKKIDELTAAYEVANQKLEKVLSGV